MALTSTQIGTLGENLLINAMMKASDGALAPFQPYADDDGVDVLFFHKPSGASVAIQLKCRTATLFKPKTTERGNLAHFQVRKATFNPMRNTYLVAALLDSELTKLETVWLLPMGALPDIARNSKDDFVIRASKSADSRDKFSQFRCTSVAELAQRITRICEQQAGVAAG